MPTTDRIYALPNHAPNLGAPPEILDPRLAAARLRPEERSSVGIDLLLQVDTMEHNAAHRDMT